MKSYYAYIIECADGSLYTGYAANLEKRLATHNKGEGARYTRGRLPVSLVYQETCQTRSQAMTREAEIKKLTRLQKKQLISGSLLPDVSD